MNAGGWLGLGCLLIAPSLTSCATECTAVGCTSTLVMTFDHDLDLAAGPYRLDVTTPLQELRCSIGPDPTGDRSCFGHRFADLDWDGSTITLALTEPFADEVFESVEVVLSQGAAELSRQTIAVEAGSPEHPNGPDCPGTCWQATARAPL